MWFVSSRTWTALESQALVGFVQEEEQQQQQQQQQELGHLPFLAVLVFLLHGQMEEEKLEV